MENKQAPIGITLEKNYDSEFCGSIPLHLVNLIQPHGVLFTLSPEDLRIAQVSENAEQFLSLPVQALLGQSIEQFLPQAQLHELQSKMAPQGYQEKIPFHLTFTIQGRELPFTALVHQKQDYVLIELEENPVPAPQNSFMALYQQIKYITSLLKQAPTTQAVSQILVEEMKKLTGFDRILLYQFDPQWNGIVISQAKQEDMDDYLGLRFPASDVPKQARDLYFSNPYRLIPTRDYTPVRMNPVINPLTHKFTDLSECNLRSVATVHLEYLTNLRVQASMSLPIIIDNQLWGLVSCHHKTPKNPSYELRSAMELLSSIVSAQIAAKEKERAIELRSQLRDLHAQLLEQLYTSDSFAEGLLNGQPSLLQLLNISGAAVLYEGSIWTTGAVPSSQNLKELVYWLKRQRQERTYATDTLPLQYARSQEYKDVASGLVVLPINAEEGEYILGFRPEVIQTIAWGGDPNQAIQMEPDGKKYHPRNSFATYQETVKHTSMPWLPEELEAAEFLRGAILEKIIKEKY
ncbi:GAF domain-containing protein [Nibribacter ruber]|uniref:GAF domain-containing protein n=1 Tax=Nibribacter ruber TaxID=2698458 RepID=A0A6P1NUH3_9BACT|nr:GAF domain-containing protein [Nibribacter ruber]QHL85964.1 GAF domain-containing protein [Nibribacter ruber]